MKVVHIKNEQQRDACLARLCAEVYGHEAGIAPLVSFAGTLSVLIRQDAARILALVDNASQPAALALLVLDKQGQSMEVALMAGLELLVQRGLLDDNSRALARKAVTQLEHLRLKLLSKLEALEAKLNKLMEQQEKINRSGNFQLSRKAK